MTSHEITKKQKILINFIDNFIKTHKYSPTFREIMRGLDYKSVATVAKHVDNLILAGFLEKEDGKIRSIRVIYLENQETINAINQKIEILRQKSNTEQKIATLEEAIKIISDIK